MPGFVDDEEDVLAPRTAADQRDHFLHAFFLADHLRQLQPRQVLRIPEHRGVILMGEFGGYRQGHEWIAPHDRPTHPERGLDCRLEFGFLAIAFDEEFEVSDLGDLRIARPLLNFHVQHVAHRHGGVAGDLLRTEVEQDHLRVEAIGHGRQQGLGLVGAQAFLECIPEEAGAELPLGVQGEAEVLAEGALTRAIETGDPDPDLRLTTIEGVLHQLQELDVGGVDLVGDDVLGDFRLQLRFFNAAVGDDFFDLAIQRAMLVEEGANSRHVVKLTDVLGAVVGIGGIELEIA